MKLPRFKFLRLLCVAAVALCSPLNAVAEDLEALSADKLVKMLASSNPVPKMSRRPEPEPKRPPGYDSKAQDRIYEAWNELLRRDESVLPALIAHLDDRRYSVTENTGPNTLNRSVGGVCLQILTDMLDPDNHVTREPGYPSYVRSEIIDQGPAKWLENHERWSLREIQIEACEWFLRQRISDSIIKTNQEKVRTKIGDVLKDLKASNRPYVPRPHKPAIRF